MIKFKNVVNHMWPWSRFRRLELAREQAIEAEKKKLLTVQQSAQSYRDLVTGFQSFCQQEIPPAIWQELVRRYIETWLPGEHSARSIRKIRAQMEAAGFTGIGLWNGTEYEPIGPPSDEMIKAWEELRKKWEREEEG